MSLQQIKDSDGFLLAQLHNGELSVYGSNNQRRLMALARIAFKLQNQRNFLKARCGDLLRCLTMAEEWISSDIGCVYEHTSEEAAIVHTAMRELIADVRDNLDHGLERGNDL